MKFQCQVRVLNRTHRTRSSPHYVKSTIALGKETHSENDYFLLHFSNLSRGSMSGSRYTKYRLRNNRTQIFTKCLKNGRITLSFEDPSHDLFIQADILHLINFIEVLKACLAGEVDALQPFASMAMAKESYNQHCDQDPTVEEIKSVSDCLPISTKSSISTNTTLNCRNIPDSSADIMLSNVLDCSNIANEVDSLQPSASCNAKKKQGLLLVDKHKKVFIDKDTIIISSIREKSATNPNNPASSITKQEVLSSSSISSQIDCLQLSPSCSSHNKEGSVLKGNEKNNLIDKDVKTASFISMNTVPNCPKNTYSPTDILQQNISSSSNLTTGVDELQPASTCCGKNKQKVLFFVNKDQKFPVDKDTMAISSIVSTNTASNCSNISTLSTDIREQNVSSTLSILSDIDGLQPPPACIKYKTQAVPLKNKEKKNFDEKDTTNISCIGKNIALNGPKLPAEIPEHNTSSSFSIVSEVQGLQSLCSDKRKQGAIPKYKTDSSISKNTETSCLNNFNSSKNLLQHNIFNSCSISSDVDGIQTAPTCSDKNKQAAILNEEEENNHSDNNTTTISPNSNNTTSNCHNYLDFFTYGPQCNAISSSSITPTICAKKKHKSVLKYEEETNLNDKDTTTVLSSSNNTAFNCHKLTASYTDIPDENVVCNLTFPTEVDDLDLPSSYCDKKKQAILKLKKNENLNDTISCISHNESECPNNLNSTKILQQDELSKGIAIEVNRLQARSSFSDKKQEVVLIDKEKNCVNETFPSININTPTNCPNNLDSSNILQHNVLSSWSITSEVATGCLQSVPKCSDKNKQGAVLKNVVKNNLMNMDTTTISANSNSTASICLKMPPSSTGILKQNFSSSLTIASDVDGLQPPPLCSNNKNKETFKDQDKHGSSSSNIAWNCRELPALATNIPEYNMLSSSSITDEVNSLQPSVSCDNMEREIDKDEMVIIIKDPRSCLNNLSSCIDNPKPNVIRYSSMASEGDARQPNPDGRNKNPEAIFMYKDIKVLIDKCTDTNTSFRKTAASNHSSTLDASTDLLQQDILRSLAIASDVDELQPAPKCSVKRERKMIVVYEDQKVLVDKGTMTEVLINTNLSNCPNIPTTSSDIPQWKILNSSCIAKKNSTVLSSASCNSNIKRGVALVNIDKTNILSISKNTASNCSTVPTVTDVPQENIISSSSIANEVVALLLKNLVDIDTSTISSISENTAPNCSNSLNSFTRPYENVSNNFTIASDVNVLSPCSSKNICGLVVIDKDKKDTGINSSIDTNTASKCPNIPPTSNDIPQPNILNNSSIAREVVALLLKNFSDKDSTTNSTIDKNIASKCLKGLDSPTEIPQKNVLSSSIIASEIVSLLIKNLIYKDTRTAISSNNNNTASNYPNLPVSCIDILKQNVIENSRTDSKVDDFQPPSSYNDHKKRGTMLIDENKKLHNYKDISNISLISKNTASDCPNKLDTSRIASGVDSPQMSQPFSGNKEKVVVHKNKKDTSINSSISTNTALNCHNISATSTEIQQHNVVSNSISSWQEDSFLSSASCENNYKRGVDRVDKDNKEITKILPTTTNIPYNCSKVPVTVTEFSNILNSSNIASERNSLQSLSSSGKNKQEAVPIHKDKQTISSHTNLTAHFSNIPVETSIEILKQNVLRSLSIDSVVSALQPNPICTCRTKTKQGVLINNDKKNKTAISSTSIGTNQTASNCLNMSTSSTVIPQQNTLRSSRYSSEVNDLHPLPPCSRTNKLEAEASISFNNANTASNYRNIAVSSSNINRKDNSSSLCITREIDALQPSPLCTYSSKQKQASVFFSKDKKSNTTISSLSISSASKCHNMASDIPQQNILSKSSINSDVDAIQLQPTPSCTCSGKKKRGTVLTSKDKKNRTNISSLNTNGTSNRPGTMTSAVDRLSNASEVDVHQPPQYGFRKKRAHRSIHDWADMNRETLPICTNKLPVCTEIQNPCTTSRPSFTSTTPLTSSYTDSICCNTPSTQSNTQPTCPNIPTTSIDAPQQNIISNPNNASDVAASKPALNGRRKKRAHMSMID